MSDYTTYQSIRCNQGESAIERIGRAKLDGSLPAHAEKGPVKRDRWGSYPPPADRQVLGDVQEADGSKTYFVLAAIIF